MRRYEWRGALTTYAAGIFLASLIVLLGGTPALGGTRPGDPKEQEIRDVITYVRTLPRQ